MSGLELDVALELDEFELAVALETTARVTALFGASGAGKSTLLEIVAGVRSAKGRLRFQGETWLDGRRSLAPERRAVGWVPQDGLLFPRLDVRANLLAGASRARARGSDVERTLSEVAATLGIAGLLARDVDTLSGGERQRVALGRALCSAPRLLLLDEPFGALDLPLRRSLLPYLKAVTEHFEVPVLFVSHDPVEVELLAGEVLVLSQGKLSARGTPRELLSDPSTRRLGSSEGYVNTLAARILDSSAEATRLSAGSLELTALGSRLPAGAAVLVEIAARDVLIANQRPAGLSARNLLPARVTALREFGAALLLDAQLDDDTTLRVELSRAAASALELEVGRSVTVIIKASACRLLGDASGS